MLLKSMTKCSFLQVTYFQDGSYTPVSQCILRSLTKVEWSRYGLTVKEVQSADCIGGVLQFQEQASFSSMHIILHTYHLYIQQLVNSVVHCMLFAWESVGPYLRVSNWWCGDKDASLNCQHISHSSQTADVHGTCWTCQFCPFTVGFYRMPKTRDWKLTLLGWQQKENVVQTSYFCCLQPDNNRFIKRVLWYLNSWAPVCRRTYVPGEATMVKAAVEKSMNELKTSFPHLFFSQHATQVWTWQTHDKWSVFQSFFLPFLGVLCQPTIQLMLGTTSLAITCCKEFLSELRCIKRQYSCLWFRVWKYFVAVFFEISDGSCFKRNILHPHLPS